MVGETMSPVYAQILVVAAPYVVPVLLALLTVAVKAIINRLPSNVQPQVQQAVSNAVQAVEQMSASTPSSAVKKQMAINFVKQQLTTMHISLPDDVISALIESAVYDLNLLKTAPASAPMSQANAPTAPEPAK
jgi:LL-H family phage holin